MPTCSPGSSAAAGAGRSSGPTRRSRTAAPRRAIGRALSELAAVESVEVAVVCRGGGSLTDLWAFCDETLCRTVALLRLPVVSAVGHESDRTLIDDVAAVSCSTPTHAAEALIRRDVDTARSELRSLASIGARAGAAAVTRRATRLAECSAAPTRSLREERRRLHQMLREVRASATRGAGERLELAATHALVVKRKADAYSAADAAARGQLTREARAIRSRTNARVTAGNQRIDAIARSLDAHDPQRTLERGYARVTDSDGETIASAATARERERVVIRFADDAVDAKVERDRGE